MSDANAPHLLYLHGTNKQSTIMDGDYRRVSDGSWSMFYDGDVLPADFKHDFDKESHCALFFKNQALLPQAKQLLTEAGLDVAIRNRWIYDVCPDLNSVTTTRPIKGYKLAKNFDSYDESDPDDILVVQSWGYKDVADARERGIGYDVLFHGDWVGSATLTAPASDGTRDISVEISEEHRNKGVGTYVGGIVVEECLRENAGIPVWDAPSVVSARVGAKIGFSGRRKYQVLLINGVEGYPPPSPPQQLPSAAQEGADAQAAPAATTAAVVPPPLGALPPPPPIAVAAPPKPTHNAPGAVVVPGPAPVAATRKPAPVVAPPKPAAVAAPPKPAPVAVAPKPAPVAAPRKPAAVVPKPAPVAPKPVAVAAPPKPAPVAPKPVAVAPKPAAVVPKPAPVAPKPAPVAVAAPIPALAVAPAPAEDGEPAAKKLKSGNPQAADDHLGVQPMVE